MSDEFFKTCDVNKRFQEPERANPRVRANRSDFILGVRRPPCDSGRLSVAMQLLGMHDQPGIRRTPEARWNFLLH